MLIIRSPLGLITMIKQLIKGELPKSLWSLVILTLITSGFSIYRIYKMIDLIIGSNKNYNKIAALFKDWFINVYSKQNV